MILNIDLYTPNIYHHISSKALYPIVSFTVSCEVLWQICQGVNPDPWIIQLALGKLGSALKTCFCDGMESLDCTDNVELKNLQKLASSLHSVNRLTLHALGSLEGIFLLKSGISNRFEVFISNSTEILS